MGHEVAVVVPDRWRHEYAAREIHPVRLSGFTGPLVPLPVWRPGSVPLHGYLGSTMAVLRRLAPEVAYIEEEPYSIAAFQWVRGAARLGIPVVFFTAQNIRKKYPLPFRLSEHYVWTRSAVAVCATESVAGALRRRGYVGKESVIPYAVDTASFRPQPADKSLVKQLALRKRVLAYLGRLVEEKGIRTLLQAYRQLPDRPTTSLLCIGSGPLADLCRSEPGVVVVEGIAHSDVQRYLALADVLALPSLTTPNWKEQFGRAAVEAMACGVPVIGSESGEIPNVLKDTGGGVTVREGDAGALGDAITRLLNDRDARRVLGNRGRAAVDRMYSTRAVAARLSTALALDGC